MRFGSNATTRRVADDRCGIGAASRSLRHRAVISSALAVGTFVVISGPLVAHAATATQDTFTFSGGLKGTLHEPSGSCDGKAGDDFGAEWNELVGSLGGQKSSAWSITINTADTKGGTFNHLTPPSSGAPASENIVLQDQSAAWRSYSGSFTLSKSGGSAKVVLRGDTVAGQRGVGAVTMVAKFFCVATS